MLRKTPLLMNNYAETYQNWNCVLFSTLLCCWELGVGTSRRTVVSDGHDWTRLSDYTVYIGLIFPRFLGTSYPLPLFHCLISILLFPCEGFWENTRARACTSSPFSIDYRHIQWNLLSSGIHTLLW